MAVHTITMKTYVQYIVVKICIERSFQSFQGLMLEEVERACALASIIREQIFFLTDLNLKSETQIVVLFTYTVQMCRCSVILRVINNSFHIIEK